LADTEFVNWKNEEMISILKTSRMMLEETQTIVAEKMRKE
jgi:hypothetical protein